MRLSSLFVLVIFCSCTPNPALDLAHGQLKAEAGLWQLQLLDAWRDPLPSWSQGGVTWVEAREGQPYRLRLKNHSGQRVEAVITVDGRDVISGQPGSYEEQRGYIIEPYGELLVEGFRKSFSQVATFRFSKPDQSYASRMGDARNLGVVGAAIFKEATRSAPVGIAMENVARDRAAPLPAAPPLNRRSRAGKESSLSEQAPRQNLGTAYGEARHSQATEAPFKRGNSRPEILLAVYYDDRAGLIRRGIIPAPQSPDPFPARSFAPPPP